MQAGTATAEQTLTALNERFAVAERGRDEEFFRSVLADALVFRRANGTRVGKEQFVEGLMDESNRFDQLEAEDLEVVIYGTELALASLVVHAAGERAGERFEGDFRNTRLFVKEDGDWKCAVWFNTREPSAAGA
jgi:ketosteroid isomerase-like protein